ncbi:hypothetical protein QFC22_001222 [Naganishia vaughanmartiniae]|uniref:Uncharacterized protein n=1 Tax=Naganishia vaughanmartiniae TaxID=1424756 RepID=A0ACC2XHC3_9TREE|nr:hypothetical protein QFC22_001222 [Naganishia vaughanmartiniae]
MTTPMNKLPQFGESIGEHVGPTFGLYFPLLAAKVDAGEFLEPTEHSYGPLERHMYDLYLPPSDVASEKGNAGRKATKLPMIVFIHGGGMVQGDKQIKPCKGGAHRNIGTFFAKRGYMVIIPNYRLRITDPTNPLYNTPQNAQFPSGGIDIALLLRHLSAPSCHVSSRIDSAATTLVGNSAGGVHAATYLYRDAIPDFEERLAPLATDPTLTPSLNQLTPSSVMFIGMPAHFRAATSDRNAVLFGYHCPELFDVPAGAAQEGSEAEKEIEMKRMVEERCPVGLRKKSVDQTRVGTMLAQLDPETEIAGPSREFTKVYKEVTEKPAEELFIKGHNHISVPLGLGLGGEEEAWGTQLIEWIEKGREGL